MGGVVDDLRMVRVEGAGRRIDAVAALGDGQRHDPQSRIVERGDDGAAVLADRHEIHHGAADARPLGAGFELDHRGQPALGFERAAHLPVVRPHPGAEERPVEVAAGVEQVVEIDGLMRPVEIADPDMQDAGAQPRPVVGRPGDRVRQGGKGRGAERHGHGLRDLIAGSAAQLIQLPPSTFNVCATTYSASSEARNTAAPAWSSGRPMRPYGTASPTRRFFSPRRRFS